MNAPKLKQIIKLVRAKKSIPIELAICELIPIALKESTIAAQMLKPITDAPTKMDVAFLL
jgi:hypothetical protein